MVDKSIYLLFFLAILIHNIEEALWFPRWSKYSNKFPKRIEQNEFNFAVLMITILALLATSAIMILPSVRIFNYIYFGFLGAMIVNIFVPHLATTIIFKKYTPGLLSGLLLILPINSFILLNAVDKKIISCFELIVATLIIGLVLLLLLPLLFKLARIFK